MEWISIKDCPPDRHDGEILFWAPDLERGKGHFLLGHASKKANGTITIHPSAKGDIDQKYSYWAPLDRPKQSRGY
jgi:hypothetical protein